MTDNIERQLAKILSKATSAPFLFIGSGFSRRYIGLPDWEGLLERFSKKPFVSYLGKTDNNTPAAALLLAEDYYNNWWDNNVENALAYESEYWDKRIEIPLKYDISEYLKTYDIQERIRSNHELKDLIDEKVVIDGIITTNWDLLLEALFPNLKVYIGQSDILFKYPTSVGGIFKIHGCCTKFNSLVLSSNDYEDFDKKNSYLVSKLLTIFLEKPIIFMGYSISDPNITDILERIENVLDSQDKIDKLSNNMIFVSRSKGEGDSFTRVIRNINGKSLIFTEIKTDDFSTIYRALQHTKRKIPVEFLRRFEEDIYNIVNSKDKADLRLKAIDFDNILENEEIDYVAGVGVASMSEYGKRGLLGITAKDLVRDIIFEDLGLSSSDIVEALPKLIMVSPVYIPIRKYLRFSNCQIDSSEQHVVNRLNLSSQSYIEKISKTGRSPTGLIEGKGYKDIINDENFNIPKTLNLLGFWLFQNKSIENCSKIKEEIKLNYKDWNVKSFHTNFKRLVCIIDEIENNDLIENSNSKFY